MMFGWVTDRSPPGVLNQDDPSQYHGDCLSASVHRSGDQIQKRADLTLWKDLHI